MTSDDARAVRIVIVDDEPLIRSGFRFVLSADPRIEIVAEASDGAEAITLVRAHRPDVVLMDVRMPGVAGPAATAEIVASGETRVLAMTSFDSEDQLFEMLVAGAFGYLLKDEPPARIIEAVRLTADGETVVSGASTAQLIRRAVDSEGRRPSARGAAGRCADRPGA